MRDLCVLRDLLFISLFSNSRSRRTQRITPHAGPYVGRFCLGVDRPGGLQSTQLHILNPFSAILWIDLLEFADSDE